jgi:outer membrane protein TolC
MTKVMLKKTARPFLLAQLLSLCSITSVSNAVAQSSDAAFPSLETFIQASRSRSIQNREAQARLAVEEAAHDAATADLLPALSANAGYTRNQYEIAIQVPDGASSVRPIITTAQNQLDATLRAQAPLVDVPAFINVRTATRRVQAASHRLEATTRDTDRAVIDAYYDRISSSGIERAAIRALQASRDSLEVIRGKRLAELASDTDVARAEAEVERRVQALAEARLSRALAERRLRTLTGLDTHGEAPLPEFDATAPPPLAELTRSLSTLPAVRAATADEAASVSTKSGAWLAFLPRLNAEASQRFTNVTGLARSPAWAAGVSAEWRLDPSTWGSARREQANVTVASLSKQRATEEALAAIEDAHEEVSARIARACAANAQITAARRAAETARARLNAGTATTLDVTLAERDVFDAEVAEAQARAELTRSRAHLMLASRPGAER